MSTPLIFICRLPAIGDRVPTAWSQASGYIDEKELSAPLAPARCKRNPARCKRNPARCKRNPARCKRDPARCEAQSCPLRFKRREAGGMRHKRLKSKI
ncbi:hypothetical protein [Croceicoccus sp. Ery5]|uniref:hypothetical protein n=1 Tax=Croceicoccus sp. Ery5 TaxID=1703340 RepID=UPI001E62A377|nr:hypothetical protein [Croceicoccus sp. Ery5]